MPRRRTVDPEFFLDERSAEVSLTARLLFLGVPCFADVEGRIKLERRKLCALIFPYETVDHDALFDELIGARLITPYEVDGIQYGIVGRWDRQISHREERKKGPEHPDPPQGDIKDALETPKGVRDGRLGVLGTRNSVPCTKNLEFEAFDRFWTTYPRRRSRTDARKAWLAKSGGSFGEFV